MLRRFQSAPAGTGRLFAWSERLGSFLKFSTSPADSLIAKFRTNVFSVHYVKCTFTHVKHSILLLAMRMLLERGPLEHLSRLFFPGSPKRRSLSRARPFSEHTRVLQPAFRY